MRIRSFIAVASLLFAPSLRAGLWFQPVAGPSGADVAALAPDRATLWAASYRGVWKLSSGAWTLDGLGDRQVTSVAVAGGSAWATTADDVLYRRGADGSWSAVTLPAPSLLPSILVADGDTLYAGGPSLDPSAPVLLRWSAGAWSSLPSPGFGFPTALAADPAGLLVGLSTGAVARLSGGSFSPVGSYVGATESVRALLSFGGLVYAGTSRALYAWNGATWTPDAGLGVHDVRAITSTGGVLRVATYDAGVFRSAGTTWNADDAGILTSRTTAFATLGSDLYVGTGGGPVYRYSGGSWSDPAPGTLNGASIADVIPDPFIGANAVIGASGAGVTYGGGAFPLPDGCGDVYALSPLPQQSATSLLAATSCGPMLTGTTGPTPASSGLPSSVLVTTLAPTTDGNVAGGTSNGGVFRFYGSSWGDDNAGLSSAAQVTTIRQVGTALYAFVNGRLAQHGSGGWADATQGLPAGANVLSLGGDARVAFAGLFAGGVSRRDGNADWGWDSWGLLSNPVSSLDVAAGRLYAAAGAGGVLVKSGGGFRAETSGFPTGAEARVVRASVEGSPDTGTRTWLYAGTEGRGTVRAAAEPGVRTVPVALDVVGGTGARFRTELTIGNAGACGTVTFTPAPGFGGGSVAPATVPLPAAAGELRIADVLEWLRAGGASIPPASASTPIAGALTLDVKACGRAVPRADSVYAIARTYTTGASGGTFGLFYDAPSDIDTAEESASVYGLRSVSGRARSNLALVHVPSGRSADPITLSVQVYDASGHAAGAPIARTLAPGEWIQINGILDAAGLPDGSFGYARITRTAGIGTWLAYGVVNDAATSDGSYLAMQRPGGLGAVRRQIVPVVLDLFGAAGSHYTTELTLVNDGPIATPVDLTYQPAPGFGTVSGSPKITVNVAAHAQVTLADVLQAFRDQGVGVPGADQGGTAGTLAVDFRQLVNLDIGTTLALARTTTPNTDTATGGSFGLFYPAVARGEGSRTSATVPALRQDASARSNLAVVHVHGGSDLPMTVSAQLYDADTGAKVGSVLTATLQPGEWKQWSSVASLAGVPASTSRFYAVVTRTAGDDTFFAYGVQNDAVTSDGSYVAMIPADRY